MAEEVKLSKEAEQLIETIEKMSVLELSKLVKALEDKFGVSAAAPVAVAAPASGGTDTADEAAAAASDEVSVVLTSAGDKKIAVLKIVREITGLGLKEAKDLVDNLPKPVKEGLKKEEAEELKKKLEAEGGTVEVK